MNDLVSASLLGWVNNANLKEIFSSLISLIGISLVAFGCDFLLRRTLLPKFQQRILRSRMVLLQLIGEYRVINTLGLLISGIVFVFGSVAMAYNTKLPLGLTFATVTLKSANLFNLFVLTLAINRFIFALHDYYQLATARNIKLHWHSYIKIISFFTWILMAILAASYIFDQSPRIVLTGLGAASAIFLLIFRDTILGIVASLQANASSMVMVGDYVTIPKHNIEGTIEDISINIVRIRNEDNTMATLPTYALTTEVINNWQSMKTARGRRFRFAILIAPDSISFVTPALINKIAELNPTLISGLKSGVGFSKLTNLTLFRLYIQNLLEHHTELNHAFSNLVRLRPVIDAALPLEITGFSYATLAYEHEQLRAAITEELYALLPLFNLQNAYSRGTKSHSEI